MFEWQALNFNANQGVKGLERVITLITLEGAKELRNHVARLISQKNEQRKTARGRGRGKILNFGAGPRMSNNTVPVAYPTQNLATSRKILQNTTPGVQFVGPSEKERNERACKLCITMINRLMTYHIMSRSIYVRKNICPERR